LAPLERISWNRIMHELRVMFDINASVKA
jgi:hypothetical protein